ncbi:MAG: hypothetical protein H6607_10120 [Flavobacteriales bacterium]|nr:hypothetical protein [Flavobacteriales bacterium]
MNKKKHYLLAFCILISGNLLAQNEIEKPTTVSIDFGSNYRHLGVQFDRVYKQQDKISFSYGFGGTMYNSFSWGRKPQVSSSWRLLFSKNRTTHFELGFNGAIRPENRINLSGDIGFRYQNLRQNGLIMRYYVTLISVDGDGFGDSDFYPGFSIGYTIK